MFRGVTHLALDNKGRLAIPARHREGLARQAEGRLVLTVNEKTRALQRLLVGHADDVVLDGAGRILVPPALRQYAALDKRVVLVGQGNKFELWDEAKWLERTEHAVAFPADGLPPELDGFSL